MFRLMPLESDDLGGVAAWGGGAMRRTAADAVQGPLRRQWCFFSRALCFVVGKERYCVSGNFKIAFLKFPVFPVLLSPLSKRQAALFF